MGTAAGASDKGDNAELPDSARAEAAGTMRSRWLADAEDEEEDAEAQVTLVGLTNEWGMQAVYNVL